MSTELATYPPIKPQPGFAGILREDVTYASGDTDSTSDRVNGWFDRLCVQSGLEISPATLLMLCLLGAVALGGAVFVFTENLLLTGVAALAGSVIPLLVTVFMRARRRRQMLDQMPGMVGELARAARTGRSLDQCWQLVAADTPSPLGDELRRTAKKMSLGMALPDAIHELPDRTGLVSMNVLTTALKVHHQSGGNLVAVLERLERTVRDRIGFLGRLQTATAASRATAILMLLVPIGVLIFFSFREPGYITNLFNSTWGRWTTIAALALQLIGTVWVIRILRNSSRT